MKNVKKLLQKAMVWAVAASMIVATPLTASAAGIRGVFSVSDGESIVDNTGTDTGTVTNTNSNTGVLSENATRIIGITLDQTYVNTEVGAKPVLNATVILDGADSKDPGLVEKLNKLIRWETSDLSKLSVDAKASDRTKATLKPKKAANKGEEVVVTASIGGNYPFTWVDKETGKTKYVEGSDVYHKVEAKVFIKEYATDLKFTKESYGEDDGVLVKHKVDLNQWLVKTPATANDDITWSISKTNVATISDDGIVTVKKLDKKAENNKFTVTAVSEKGHPASAELVVAAGTPATKVEIYEVKSGADDVLLKGTRNADIGGEAPEYSIDVKAVMYAKVDTTVKNKEELKDGSEYTPKGETVSKTLTITDQITWVTNKDKIVKVEDHGDGTATLSPVAVGTAKITATATSGKKANFNVKVAATLTGLEVAVYPDTAYTGQSVTLAAGRTPAANTSALTWSAYSDAKCETKSKDVTINNKGVLKVKNTLKTSEVYVKVESKKDKIVSDAVRINLEQSNITEIVVRDDKGALVSSAKLDGTKIVLDGTKKTEIRVPLGRDYTVEAVGEGGAASLSWTYPTNGKVVSVDAEGGAATIRAVAKGTAKFTVSGLAVTKKDDNGNAKSTKAIKAAFTVTVVQPTTSITLNKTDIVLYEKSNKNGLQDQTVSLKATMNPKGAADPITWTVYDKDGNPIAKADYDESKTKASGKNNVNYKLVLKTPAVGDEFKVVATAQTGVSKEATIKVLQKPTSIEIHDPAKDHQQFTETKANGKAIANTKYVKLGETFTMLPEVNVGTKTAANWIEAGKSNTEHVTYTQSGKGKVIIIGDAVYGVKEGKVTITAKTPNNKKATLKVEVQAN